jgi:hypothetical protein
LHDATWTKSYGYALLVKTFLAWSPFLVSWWIARTGIGQRQVVAILFATALIAISGLVDGVLIGVVPAPSSLTPVVLALVQTSAFAVAAMLYRAAGTEAVV